MALLFFKSQSEAPWDRFHQEMNRFLASAAAPFAQRHDRRLRLGSPVRVAEPGGDVIRLPVEVVGGTREYSIAYLVVKAGDLNGKLNAARLRAIAEELVSAAEPYAETAPSHPGATIVRYP